MRVENSLPARGDSSPESTPRWFRKIGRPAVHALVLLGLLGFAVHSAVRLGPWDGADAHWYIEYTLQTRDESREVNPTWEVAPLYPAYLSWAMDLDPRYEAYLECLDDNLVYWGSEDGEPRLFTDGDPASCWRMEHSGFTLQVIFFLLAIVSVWLAGYLASGSPVVAHLAALPVVAIPNWIHHALRHTPENLSIPLFAAFEALLLYLVLRGRHLRPGTRRAVAVAAGLLLGALTLTRPPYEYLLPALAVGALVWMFCDRARRREIAVSSTLLLASALLVFALPHWNAAAEEERQTHGVAATYGSSLLMQRLGFNDMTARQWVAAFVLWGGRDTWDTVLLARRLFGDDAVAALRDGTPEYLENRAREENLLAGVPPDRRLGVLLDRLWWQWPKHLAVTLPLAWRGMRQWPPAPLGNLWWLAVLFAFVWGTERHRAALLALSFCPFVVLGITAFVSQGLPRVNPGLVIPLSVGVALAAVSLADALRNRLARRPGRLAASRPNA